MEKLSKLENLLLLCHAYKICETHAKRAIAITSCYIEQYAEPNQGKNCHLKDRKRKFIY